MEELLKAQNDMNLPIEVRIAAAEKMNRLLKERKCEVISRKLCTNDFSSRLRKLRKHHKFSQAEFAELVGVSNVTISLWETGKSMPRNKNWEVLKDLLPEL